MIRQTRFAVDLLRSNLRLSRQPYKLNLYLTDICNCRCRTCNIWAKKPQKELTTEELNKFFKINNYFSWIDITGGEIFLRNDIEEIFNIIIKRCPKLFLLHFPTNGILVEKIYNTVLHIKKNFKGRLVVSISIDGDRDLHNLLRGVSGCWENAIHTFQKIKPILKEDIYFGFTISRHNVGNLMDTYLALKSQIPDLGFNKIHINLAQYSELYYSNMDKELLGRKEDIINEIRLALLRRRFKMEPFNHMETYFLKLLKKYVETDTYPYKRCAAIYSTITVNPKGEVYPCLFFNKKLGALREVDFRLDKILTNIETIELKKNILRYCPTCWTVCEAYPTILSNIIYCTLY